MPELRARWRDIIGGCELVVGQDRAVGMIAQMRGLYKAYAFENGKCVGLETYDSMSRAKDELVAYLDKSNQEAWGRA